MGSSLLSLWAKFISSVHSSSSKMMTGFSKTFFWMLLSLLACVTEAQRSVAGPNEGKELMVTPTIMTGILVGALWIMIFLVGFCCLFQVQTPSAFEEKPLVLNKQY